MTASIARCRHKDRFGDLGELHQRMQFGGEGWQAATRSIIVASFGRPMRFAAECRGIIETNRPQLCIAEPNALKERVPRGFLPGRFQIDERGLITRRRLSYCGLCDPVAGHGGLVLRPAFLRWPAWTG